MAALRDAQRDWQGTVVVEGLDGLPERARALLTDPPERTNPQAAFARARGVLVEMQYLAAQVHFFGDDPRCEELFAAIDALVTLPAADVAELDRQPTQDVGAGFLAAFLAIERMALGFERDHRLEELRRFRRELDLLPTVADGVQQRAVRNVARPRERRDGATRRSARAGPSDDDGPGEPPDPFALGPVDRLPVLWRLRVARCRWREWRAGWPA